MSNTEFLGLFPLQLVIFPGEDVNLHIFEERYQQLVGECFEEGKTFGIPPYFNEKVQIFGTEMEIRSVDRFYDSGEMDITVRGKRIFKLEDYENPASGKLYAGGTVQWLHEESYDMDSERVNSRLQAKFLNYVRQLYEILQHPAPIDENTEQPLSWSLAHKITLSLEQEYKLLTTFDEEERLQFMIKHMRKTIPIINQVEQTKRLIKMNGHFRKIDPPSDF